jgi:Skp family chaperone for outer membrane proteins
VKKIFLIFYLVTFSFLYSEGQKIGYVDIQYIMSQNEDARLAHADVEKEANRLKVEYETKAILLDSLMRDYQSLELMLTDDIKLEKQKTMQELSIELENFQMKYFGQPNGEIYVMLADRMAPIEKLIMSAIEEVAAEKSYDYVLDVSQGFILHALESWNLTQLVIDKLNKISTESTTE